MFTDMIKDIDEQPGEEVHKARSGRVPSTGALSCGVGMHYPSLCEHVHQSETSEPCILEIFDGGFIREA